MTLRSYSQGSPLPLTLSVFKELIFLEVFLASESLVGRLSLAPKPRGVRYPSLSY